MIAGAGLILFLLWAGWYNRRQAQREAAAQAAQEPVLRVAPDQPGLQVGVSRNKTGPAWVQDELIDLDAEMEDDF